MTEDESRETAGILATLVIAGITLFLLMLWVTSAAASPICLTKSEARKLWPRQHIYWYSKDHCWSNRRGGPPRGIKIERVMAQAEEQKKEPRESGAVIKIGRWDEVNEIDAQLLVPPIPFLDYVLDIDLSRYRTWYDRNGAVAQLSR
jgi:hypothetical protein